MVYSDGEDLITIGLMRVVMGDGKRKKAGCTLQGRVL